MNVHKSFMKTNFAYWILAGVVAGVALALMMKNIVAGVSCCSAVSNLPVLFAKRKQKRVRI